MYLSPYHLFLICLLSATLISPAAADDNGFKGGHLQYRFLVNTFADDSVLNDFIDSPAIDQNGDARLLFDWRKDKVSLVADYQLLALYGDSFTLADNFPGSALIPTPVPNDDNRLFNLSDTLSETNNSALVQRLDRLYLGYSGDKTVLRFGRQALSWGNGLIYTPMDFINPFDPSAVNKEYKTGDDMFYGQYLQNNGNDVQAAWVIRRDTEGNVSSDVDSIALKYHGFIGNKEYDLLLAQHYNDSVVGIGGITDIGTAIWRGDITFTNTQTDTITSLATSLSYSWTAWDHNISGILEYFYNGFGISDGNYSPTALADKPELVERLQRGELFTLGRNYIVASAMVEISPLWLLTPNVFVNINDPSFLVQLVSTYDLKQNVQLLAAVGAPVGASGTEYGGIDSGIAGKPLSTEFNLFAQLAWYF